MTIEPMRAPSEVLAYMAAVLDVSEWREEWPEDVKRKVISAAINESCLRRKPAKLAKTA